MHMLARLRNRIVSGFIFIMPVLITVLVLGQFWKRLMKIGSALSKMLGIDTILGPAGDAVAAVLFFVTVCLVAGYLTRISFLRRVSEKIDEKLNQLIPGYSQVRTEATKKVGLGKSDEPRYDTCLVKVGDLWEPGYLVETNIDGTHTVFVPQAPLAAVGHVYVVEPGRVRKLDFDSAALNARLKQLGKGVLASAGGLSPRSG
jgi:uncharacterized membrane protein